MSSFPDSNEVLASSRRLNLGSETEYYQNGGESRTYFILNLSQDRTIRYLQPSHPLLPRESTQTRRSWRKHVNNLQQNLPINRLKLHPIRQTRSSPILPVIHPRLTPPQALHKSQLTLRPEIIPQSLLAFITKTRRHVQIKPSRTAPS